tara:strand:- start:516 stop:893 length:378 start_codon:yes stop_codon:yes gene_type:complete
MRISEHLARVDLDALNKLPDDKNKQWLLSFYNEHKNGRFNASLKQIQLIEKSFPLKQVEDHDETVDEVSKKFAHGTKNTDNWISMCGFMNAFINQGSVKLDEQSISEALIVIKKGINKFKATELN